MRYVPNTPGAGAALPDGEYQFEVTNAEEKTSNTSGNDMIELTLKIKDGPTVYDYLVNVPESSWKIDNFRASIGEEIKPGVPLDINPEDFIGRRGTCLLYIDTYQGKKKNKVADYVFVIAGPGASPPAPPKGGWR
jgi:Protein of unknown function (DUF669)